MTISEDLLKRKTWACDYCGDIFPIADLSAIDTRRILCPDCLSKLPDAVVL